MKRFLFIVLCLLWPLGVNAQETTPEGDGGRMSRLIESSLSGPGRTVTVRGFRGALSARATLEELTFSDADGPWLILRNAAFDWKRSALLRRRLEVNELVAEELEVLRKPNVPTTESAPKAAAATEFALPELPVSVEVNKFAIEQIALGPDFLGEEVLASLGGRILLIDGEGLVELEMLRQNGPKDDLRLNGSYSNETKILSIDLSLEEEAKGLVSTLAGFPGQPSVALNLKGLGPLNQFQADLNLKTDDEDRLTGVIRLQEAEADGLQFSADINGDVAPLFDANYQDFLGNDLQLDVVGVRAANGALTLSELDFRAASVTLDGSLELSENLWPRKINLTGEIAPPEGQSHVLLPLSGPETDLSKLDLSVSFDHEAGDSWTASLWLQGLERDTLALGGASLIGQGSLTGSDGQLPGAVQANLILGATELSLDNPELDALLAQPISATTTLDWTKGGALNITAFDAQVAGAAAQGSAVLRDLAKGLRVSVQAAADLADLSLYADLAGLDLSGAAGVDVTAETAIVGGTFDVVVTGGATNLSLGDAQLDDMIGGQSELTLSAKRDTTGTTLRELTLNGQDVALTADGTITPTGGGSLNFDAKASSLTAKGQANFSDMQAGITIDADATLKADDLSEFAALAGVPIAGQIALDVSGGGNLKAQNFDATAKGNASDFVVGIAALDDLIGGRAKIDVSAAKTGTDIILRNLLLETEDIDVKASGTVGAQTGALQFDAQVASLTANGTADLSDMSDGITVTTKTAASVGDLSDFAELAGLPLAGQVSLDLSGSGNLAGLSFDAEVKASANDLVTGIEQADQLIGGTALIDISAARSGNDIDIRRFTATAKEVDVTASGKVDNNGGAIDFDARVATASAKGQAQLSDMDKGISIATSSSVAVSDLRPIGDMIGQSLSGAVDISLQASANVESQDFDAVLSGTMDSLGIGIAQVDQLFTGATTLAVSAQKQGTALTLRELTVDGSQLDLSASGQLDGDKGAFTFEQSLASLAVFEPQLTGGVTLSGNLNRSTQGWGVDVDAVAEDGFSSEIDGTVSPDFQQFDMAISGSAPLAIANAFIQPRSVLGTANYNLSIKGPPALESVSGQISIEGGRASAPTVNLALENIGAQIALSGSNLSIDASTDVSQGGQVRINGTLAAVAPFNSNLSIVVDGVKLTDPALYDTTIDGEIDFAGPATGGASISGVINLGETNVRIPTSSVGISAAPEGIVYLNETRAQFVTRERAGFIPKEDTGGNGGPSVAFPLNVAVNADQRITIRGRGLDLVLGGDILLTGSTNNILSEGEFDLIRGQLNFLSKRLTLEEANIALLGGLMPFIHIEAVTDIPDGTARIIIDGPAADPDFEFTSDPDLPDDEVLAQILFGKSLSDLSALQTAQLAASVAELAGGKSIGLVSGIRDSLGLDDLNLETNSEGNATVRAGRQLTEDIYTDVAVDSEGETELNINLDVTDNFTAKASVGSDGESSLGFFFQKDY